MNSLEEEKNPGEEKHSEAIGSENEDDEVENPIFSRASQKKGSRKLPFVWSKVIHITPDTSSEIR